MGVHGAAPSPGPFRLGGWAAGRLGGWAARRLGSWAAGNHRDLGVTACLNLYPSNFLLGRWEAGMLGR
ncbi:MAG: hypothetical protein D6708_03245 [Candidatus Dadabacteria bacterium]|nr:MAG: hypothetical protein D6708_03245 [Candidatus Dadabacteria bacterium]